MRQTTLEDLDRIYKLGQKKKGRLRREYHLIERGIIRNNGT